MPPEGTRYTATRFNADGGVDGWTIFTSCGSLCSDTLVRDLLAEYAKLHLRPAAPMFVVVRPKRTSATSEIRLLRIGPTTDCVSLPIEAA